MVMKSLVDAKTKWEFLGLELEIPAEELESIKRTECGNVDQCFLEMLKRWLRIINPSPSWEGLVKALRSRLVGHPNLAESIAAEHNIPLSGRFILNCIISKFYGDSKT